MRYVRLGSGATEDTAVLQWRGGRSNRRARGLQLAFSLILLLFLSAPAQAAASKLVWLATSGGGTSLRISDADGSNARSIPIPQTHPAWPALSPDQKMVAYVDSGTLYITDIYGEHVRVLKPAAPGTSTSVGAQAWSPTFTPDGTRVVFGSQDSTTESGDLESVSVNGGDAVTVVSDPGSQNAPAYSPDGQHLAYTTAGIGGKPQIYVDGSYLADGANPRFSLGGDRISYTSNTSRLIISSLDGTNVTEVPAAGNITTADWVGANTLVYDDLNTTGLWTIDLLTNSISTVIAPQPGMEYWDANSPDRSDTADSYDLDQKLAAYSPYLKFDVQESYFPMSAAAMTDNYVHKGKTVYSNFLKSADGTVIAASDPANAASDLSLAFLTSPYPGGVLTPRTDDYLDEADGSYQSDANRLYTSGYGGFIYGRVVQDPNSMRWWLQYWIFYYYNPRPVQDLGYGEHEGDWEMVQYRLGAYGVPDLAVYAQHNGGECRAFADVETQSVGSRSAPVVYVGVDGHESFFAAEGGTYGTQYDGARILDEVSPAPDWLVWPGRWGGSTGGLVDTPSPPSPSQQGDKWADPESFATNSGCGSVTPSASVQRALPAPSAGAGTRGDAVALPRLDAARDGNHVRVRYTFGDRNNRPRRRPDFVRVAVTPRGNRMPPVAAVYRVSRRTTTRVFASPSGQRLTVSISAYRNGERSSVHTVRVAPLRRGAHG